MAAVRRYILPLLILAVLVSGFSGDLRVCLGADGHLHVLAIDEHICHEETADRQMHDDEHGICLDLLLCAGNGYCLREVRASQPLPLVPPAPSEFVSRFLALRETRVILPDTEYTRSSLDDLRTIVLLL